MIDRDFIELQAALAGDYSLERELGRGGMGIVYLAREVQLDRYVAVKVLPQSLAIQPEVRERFLREARLAASLLKPTPMDRPEDVETNPVNGRVYITAYSGTVSELDPNTLKLVKQFQTPMTPDGLFFGTVK